jgi:hypothetical protein
LFGAYKFRQKPEKKKTELNLMKALSVGKEPENKPKCPFLSYTIVIAWHKVG